MAEHKKYEVTVEQVKNWFKANDISNPSDDWIQHYVNNPDEERCEQYKEAVIDGYSRMDFEQWQHFKDVIGTTCSFKCFLKCAEALEDDDIAIFDLDDRSDKSITPVMSSSTRLPLNNNEDAVAHLCEVLNWHDYLLDMDDVRTPLKTEDLIPIFKSTSYFGIFCYHEGENEYYLVDRSSGSHTMVLGDSFEFVGKNTLACMQGEDILHVANKEFLHYLVHFSLENAKGIIPIKELSGIAVLERALREENRKHGAYTLGPSLADEIKAAAARDSKTASYMNAEKQPPVSYKCWTIFENNGHYTVGGTANHDFSDCTLENLTPSINEKQMVDWCRELDAVSLTFQDLRKVGSESEASYEKYLAHLAKYDSEQADDFLSEEFIVPVVRFSSVEAAKDFLDWLDKELTVSASMSAENQAPKLNDQIKSASGRAAAETSSKTPEKGPEPTR